MTQEINIPLTDDEKRHILFVASVMFMHKHEEANALMPFLWRHMRMAPSSLIRETKDLPARGMSYRRNWKMSLLM